MAHFSSTVPDTIRCLTNQEAVKRYLDDRSVPKQALIGLTTQQLNCHPVPGTWSIQQILVHLMDTDLIASYRMKRIIAEDRPRFELYDENAFADRLSCEKMEASLACELFRINRMVTAQLLRQLPDETFDRAADHPEIGDISLGTYVRLFVHHLEHHNRFLREKRRLVREGG